jgi:hypothetical protein
MDLGSSVFMSLASWGGWGGGLDFNLPSSYHDTQEYLYFVGVFLDLFLCGRRNIYCPI